MARPRFSELLLARRRQRGLSAQQASKVLKLKEPVLIAFEEGDWEHIPQSGYAQGMLSSYARYLGLNPREVVDLFQEELYEHVNGTANHELRRRTRDTQSGRGVAGYDVLNETDSRPKAYVEYHGLLPTAGGPAGDLGDFATTSGARPRQSSVPLSSNRSSAESAYSHTEYVYGHPNNVQRGDSSRQTTRQRGQSGARRRPDNDPTGRLLREGQNGSGSRSSSRSSEDRASSRSQRLYRHDDVSRRNVLPNEYDDDLRYDDSPNPYERASTISGRRSSRNIANVDHPNVRRRSATNTRRRHRRRGGVLGLLDDFFADGRRVIFLVIVVLAVILTLIIVTSVSSCVSSDTTQSTRTVAVTSADSSSSTGTTTGTTTDTSTDTTSNTSTTDSAATTTTTPTETDVTVTLASGQVSWVEIQCDGASKVADTLTGPWSGTYTVTDSITIQVSDTNAVQVTKNGTAVSFESRASGIGTVTIAGTPATTDASASTTSTDGATTTTGTTSV